jgi:hypothetical protein
MLDFSETLDTFEDSGVMFNERCGLELGLLANTTDFMMNGLSSPAT